MRSRSGLPDRTGGAGRQGWPCDGAEVELVGQQAGHVVGKGGTGKDALVASVVHCHGRSDRRTATVPKAPVYMWLAPTGKKQTKVPMERSRGEGVPPRCRQKRLGTGPARAVPAPQCGSGRRSRAQVQRPRRGRRPWAVREQSAGPRDGQMPGCNPRRGLPCPCRVRTPINETETVSVTTQ